MCLPKIISPNTTFILVLTGLTCLSCSMIQESVEVLLKCVSQNVGFSHGKPVAALTIYKCLIHWKIFEADKTSIFDRIVPVFGSAIEVTREV